MFKKLYKKMNDKVYKKSMAVIMAAALSMSLIACGTKKAESDTSSRTSNSTSVETEAETASGKAAQQTEAETGSETGLGTETSQDSSDENTEAFNAEPVEAATTTGGAMETTDLFTDRDLTQEADLSSAESLTLKSGEDLTITAAGVYVITGTAEDSTIIVEAGDEDKVQLVLDGVSITNSDSPAIYVKSADKVFVTTTDSENSLTVSGTFTADGDTNTDAVIFSRDDLTLNGTGSLTISSTDNGISGKDDLKITGGSITISCTDAAIEANDSIRIAGGNINITAANDGLHAENDEDDSLGYIYICGGTLNIQAADDGIHGTTIVQIDAGTIDVTAAEGIEGTWVQVNGGTISVTASDDGINAANKSSAYSATAEFNGGSVTIDMGQGDTDGVDSNGSLTITGGTISVNGQSAFDYDGQLTWDGGTVIVNGTEVTEISNQMMGPGGGMMGPGGMGGDGGFPGGDMNGGDWGDMNQGPGGRRER